MTTMITMTPFHEALAAAERSPALPEAHDLYGWLVGSWELDVRHYAGVDVGKRGIIGELHAGRALQGFAVQDVWIMPRRSDRRGPLDKGMTMYGTTLRIWDATLAAWRIRWSNPEHDHHEQQIGRRSGKDIVQLGTRPDGTATRWMFTEISPSSFHWLGHSLALDGATWQLEGEFLARRAGS
jgi:hypothetical protein